MPPTRRTTIETHDDRTGMDDATLTRAFLDHVSFTLGKRADNSTALDRFFALALTIRDRLTHRWSQTQQLYVTQDAKRVYYLSAEFLLGRSLGNNLMALGLLDRARELLRSVGLDLTDLLESEPDPGLGNGGLGRLAACFLDSMATLGIPGYGYGIRYQFGIFEQSLREGWQVERPDEWLKFNNPWEIIRPEHAVTVRFGGRVENGHDEQGRFVARWVDTHDVLGVPYDTPIAGFQNDTVNTLRLWEARASNEFDLGVFNDGDYVRAVEDKNASEVISKVLYPNDHNQAGRDLRLKQEYFFVACSIADIVRRHLKRRRGFADFAEKNAIQLNDTHPAIAVAELMRVLVDEHHVVWDEAWATTVATLGYTNHTLLAEALERWPVDAFERLLPRHLGIIYEINRRHLRAVRTRYPGDEGRVQRLSIIEEGSRRMVRMAHLAVVGSHAVNGVAALHTELLKRDVLADFADLAPEKFSNKTNGVTPRRWLRLCNPRLADLITEAIGPGWIRDADELAGLRRFAADAAFVEKIAAIKRANKVDLATHARRLEHRLDPDSLHDVQIKRMHEYKRQLLNALHVVRLYLDLKHGQAAAGPPRTVLIAGKSAPGYHAAKLIIKLINSIAEVVNADPALQGRLKLAFLPNYRVSLAEKIIPAADLSEQISTAGKEASGTGNMKLSMNGALTIGTLDGANVEIRAAMDPADFFLFGLDADEVAATLRHGYRPREVYERTPRLREVLDLIASGFFSPEAPELFRPIIDDLLDRDPYLVLADFESYVACQAEVARAFLDRTAWHAKVVRNIAAMGQFSSDRTIRQYAEEIWQARGYRVELQPHTGW